MHSLHEFIRIKESGVNDWVSMRRLVDWAILVGGGGEGKGWADWI